MRDLSALIIAISLATNASAGYPVYGNLRNTVYKVPNGTGFTVEYEGRIYMITNWHVCRYYDKGSATNEENGYTTPIRVIKRFPKEDLCVMTTKSQHGLSIGSDPGVGAAIYIGGYPQYAQTIQLRTGHVLRLAEETIDYGSFGDCPKGFEKGAKVDPITKQTTETCSSTQNVYDTDAEGTHGNSGSPVLNSRGQLVGIVHSEQDGTPADDHHNTLNFLPVSLLKKVLASLKTE